MAITRAQIEKKYNCTCVKYPGFDDYNSKFWVAIPNGEEEDHLFDGAEGWTLDELVENIKEALYE